MQTGSQKPQGVRRGRGEQKRNRAGQGWSFSLPHATLPSPQGPNSGGVAGSDGVGSPQSLSKLQPPAAPYTGAGRGQARRGPSSRAPLPAPLRRKKALGVALIPPEAKAREAKASPFPGGGRGNPLEGPWAARLTFLRLTDPSREGNTCRPPPGMGTPTPSPLPPHLPADGREEGAPPLKITVLLAVCCCCWFLEGARSPRLFHSLAPPRRDSPRATFHLAPQSRVRAP